MGRDGCGRRAARRRSLARLLLCGSSRPVRHSTGRNDFRAQDFDRRAMPHRGLSNKRKRVRLRHAVTAHDMQNGGEHNASGSNAVIQFFDVCGFVNSSLRGGGSAGSCSEIVIPRRLSWRRTIEISRSSLITMSARRPRTEKGGGLVISRYADRLSASSSYHCPFPASRQSSRGQDSKDKDRDAQGRQPPGRC
jgi:hypothetical protein